MFASLHTTCPIPPTHPILPGSLVQLIEGLPHGSPLQTMPYMPPELLEHSQLTPAADTYSFGMIMWECFTGQARHHLAFGTCFGSLFT